MKLFKKIITVICCIAIFISALAGPVFAVESGGWTGNTLSTGGFSGAGYWDVVYSSPDAPAYGDEVLKGLGKLSSEDACPTSETGHHVGSAYRVRQGEKRSIYVADCRCDACSSEFSTIVTVEELNAAYNSYVSSLPSSNLDSEGYLLWQPAAYKVECKLSVGGSYAYFYYPDSAGTDSDKFTVTKSVDGPWYCFVGTYNKSGGVSSYPLFTVYLSDSCPIDGYYWLHDNLTGGFTALTFDGESVSFSTSASFSDPPSFKFYPAGSTYTDVLNQTYFSQPKCTMSYFDAKVLSPLVRIKPVSGLIDPSSDTTYNINTRPTFISNDYGFYDESGEPQLSQGTQIVNEAGGKFYNPVTGNTLNVSNWTYDYADRKYDGVADDGTQWAVTYGDGDITIVEGDKTYNIYYMLPAGPADNCQHEYTSTVTTAPTCTFPGTETFTCSKCQHSYTQSIPARGHTWQVKQTVTTQYDESGNLVTQGYTIYECSVCHEQYKSEDGALPPGGGSGGGTGSGEEKETIWQKIGKLFGTIGDGVISLIEAAFGKVLDGLISLAETLVAKLKTVVETVLGIFDELPSLFNGFLDFLVVVFPFLPPELITVLTFGIVAVVFIGIIKAVRK